MFAFSNFSFKDFKMVNLISISRSSPLAQRTRATHARRCTSAPRNEWRHTLIAPTQITLIYKHTSTHVRVLFITLMRTDMVLS